MNVHFVHILGIPIYAKIAFTNLLYTAVGFKIWFK